MPTYYRRKSQVPALKPGQQLAYTGGAGGSGVYYIRRATTKPPPKTSSARPITLDAVMAQLLGSSMLTPAQERAKVTSQVDAAINAQLASLKAETQRGQDEANRQAQVARAFAQQSQESRLADAEAIRKAYADAGAGMQDLASAIGGSVSADMQSRLADANAAAAQFGPGRVVTPADPGATGGVISYLGSLPGQTMAATAPAAATEAILASQAGQQRLAELGLDYGKQAQTLGAEFTRARIEAEAKRPDLMREGFDALSENRRQDIATYLSAKQLQQQTLNAAQDAKSERERIALEKAKLKAQTAAAKAKTSAEAQKLYDDALRKAGINPLTGGPLPGYYADASGTVRKIPSGWMVGPNGNLIRSTRAPGTSGAQTPTGQKKMLEARTSTRKNVMQATRERLGLVKGHKPPKYDWSIKNVRDFVTRQFADYIATYGKGPWVKSAIASIATQIFNEHVEDRRRRQNAAAAAAGTTESGVLNQG